MHLHFCEENHIGFQQLSGRDSTSISEDVVLSRINGGQPH